MRSRINTLIMLTPFSAATAGWAGAEAGERELKYGGKLWQRNSPIYITYRSFCVIKNQPYSKSLQGKYNFHLIAMYTTTHFGIIIDQCALRWHYGLGPPFPGAAIPSICYFRITNNNNHPSYSIQLLF